MLVARISEEIKKGFEFEILNGNPDNMPTVDMIRAMRNYRDSFASSVATTVCEKMTISEKQAACIAKGLQENEESFKWFLRLLPSDCFEWVEGVYVSE